jgi:pyroglutamyl-peptidase
MKKVLLTAFEPYGPWSENASWLTLVELTRELSDSPAVTTRRYPVDFRAARERLEQDLSEPYDVVLHLGQAAGAGAIQLEAIAVNFGRDETMAADETYELEPGCPVAFRSALPLVDWSQRIRGAGIPCQVSYHAGTYLCNAVYYWTSMLIERHGWDTRVAFVHIPLACEQVVTTPASHPSLPVALSAMAIRTVLNQL